MLNVIVGSKMNMNIKLWSLYALLLLVCQPTFAAGTVEVLHWWTSKGESKAVQVLKDKMEAKGHHWKDFAIAGGGGQSAMTVLKMRAISGNPPTAAQLKGQDIQEWGRLGFLTSLNKVAEQEHWENVLLPEVEQIVNDLQLIKYDGQYVAAPVTLHRVNWLWINPHIFKLAGAKVPTTLAEFYVAADKIKAAGYIPLAHGGESWQDATLFEAVALSVLGAQDYAKAFVDLDLTELSSDKMVEAFRQFKKMRQYIDPNAKGRRWNQATEMLMHDQAAMQIMGDWAKGEFTSEHKVAGKDYLCVPVPGTQGMFSYNLDTITFFKLKSNEEDERAQQDLAQILLTKPFQREFSLYKGSIPIRKDVSLKGFDACSLASMKAFKFAAKNNALVPSFSHNLATSSDVQSAIIDVVSRFFDDPSADPKMAAVRLSRAVKSAM
ncbi:putative ABC-type sugar transport system, periplasmic component [Photobacterium angustum S14]|uniref:Probable sugar-binding periplasmic protein n=2 Tax=Photobacterium angustum TaxID=661 RepID=Q1ZWY1_PHOAS|nr:putative ABC-type sugar transport system, periplasmic component [Photobacterium angustum S14]